MKNVYVTLQGTGDVYWMESFVQDSSIIDNIDDYDLDDQIGLEEEGVLDGDLYELPFINGDLKVLLSTSSEPVWSEDDENAVDITNECECISRPNYLKGDCGLTVPLWVTITREETEVVETFCIELKDDEEFDPKKLQILRSTGEIDGVYNSIIVTDVLYDGNKIHYEDPEGYNNVEWFPTVVEEWLNDNTMKKFKKEIIISRSAYVVVEAETLEEAMELFENGEWEAGDGGEEFIDRTTYSEWDEEVEEWVDVDPDDNE